MIYIAKKAFVVLLVWILAGFPALTIPDELLAGKLRKRNPAFAISVESVLQKQGIIIVDVRDKESFEKFNIPGSINIPLFAIRTKAFLKTKSLILINEGYNYSQLERECERLRKSGFKVWLLNGGLYFWIQKGAPVKGDVFAQKELNKIPPRIFFAEKNYENWIVIDVSSTNDPKASSLFPQSISIPYIDEKKFILAFENTLKKHKDNSFISILICDEKGKQYPKVESIVKEIDAKNVFFLKGGIEAYRNFIEQQALIRQAKDHSERMPKKCARCP